MLSIKVPFKVKYFLLPVVNLIPYFLFGIISVIPFKSSLVIFNFLASVKPISNFFKSFLVKSLTLAILPIFKTLLGIFYNHN